MKQPEPTDLSGNTPSQYKRWGVDPSTHVEHEFDPDQLIPAQATSWRMEGNMLIAETNHGVLAQTIPTDYICLGIDGQGLPILKKIA